MINGLAPVLLALPAWAQVPQDPSRDQAPPDLPLGILSLELAGRSLPESPWFEFVDLFLEGQPVELAVEPDQVADLLGRPVDVYVLDGRTDSQWSADLRLVDARGRPQSITFQPGSIQANRVVIDSGLLDSFAGIGLGHAYDIVIDANNNGLLDLGDRIDGLEREHGFLVAHDTTRLGPLATGEIVYSGGSFLGQKTYFPADIDRRGRLPLVVISHGNGHDYRWYDYLGRHLASYGYVVMSHQTNAAAGVNSAATTTLTNTEFLFEFQDRIEGGLLSGHLDPNRMAWIGHSRGGEGVLRAYQRLLSGEFSTTRFGPGGVRVLAAMAPVTHMSAAEAGAGDVPFHLFYGSADSDVTGAPLANVSQPFAHYERARGPKYSAYLHGVGHAWFHSGGGPCACFGPDLSTAVRTRRAVRGYYLPLLETWLRDNPAGLEFFTRAPSGFRPIGLSPAQGLVAEYREAETALRFVIDDFQSSPSPQTSSSGTPVTTDLRSVVEGRMRDFDGLFEFHPGVPFNGMTRALETSDRPRCVVFDWNPLEPGFYRIELPQGERDLRSATWLAFRAAQGTRHPETDLLDGPLTFTVSLTDEAGRTSPLPLSNYGAVPRPYLRTGSGQGAGWANEFASFRLRLTDFQADGRALDLARVVSVRFDFGPGFGSERGRLALDDIEVVP